MSNKLGRRYNQEFLKALQSAPGGSYHNDPAFLEALKSPTSQ